MSVISSTKTQTAESRTWGSGLSDSARGTTNRRRRTKMTSEKRIADDEFMAAAIGDVEWLKQSLKDAGPDINFDKNGLTAIHLAAIHGRLECLKICIEKFKIDINLASSTGWRPIHLCISNQTGKRALQCLAYLLEKGADCSIVNDDGITPVHQAASEGHVQCIKMLLEVGAKIDGRDCRGNTPLDLAKLWGHRKCARILAAEMWHQDKDSVAKEMQQLKKVKMQQVLRELEEEEEMKAAQEFYGEAAFKQWLADRNLSGISGGPSRGSKQKVKEVGGMKPNSVARKNEGTTESTKIRVSMESRKDSKSRFADTMPTEDFDELYNLSGFEEDSAGKGDKKEGASVNWRKSPAFYNTKEWNKSTKERSMEYVPNLGDAYPRDEYTVMPTAKGMPKYYEGKFVRPLTPNHVDEDVKKKGPQAKLRRPKLSKEVINEILAKDSSVKDRGMIFKCKHIGDVHAKKKYDIEKKGRPQIGLHLSDDVRSYVVKNCLTQAASAPASSGSRTKSDSGRTAMTGSEWLMDSYPLPLVMQTLKQMSKPKPFAGFSKDEYVFSFGGVK